MARPRNIRNLLIGIRALLNRSLSICDGEVNGTPCTVLIPSGIAPWLYSFDGGNTWEDRGAITRRVFSEGTDNG